MEVPIVPEKDGHLDEQSISEWTGLPIPEKDGHLDLRKRLWERASLSLRVSEVDLVDAYEKILAYQASGGSVSLKDLVSQPIDARRINGYRRVRLGGWSARPRYERLKEKLSIEKDNREENGAKTLLIESLDKIRKPLDQVAMPWVGLFLVLEILLESRTTEAADYHNLTYMISRMNVYWNLTSQLFEEKERWVSWKVEVILKYLYRSILLWQMKTVCSYFQHQEVPFLQNLPHLFNGDEHMPLPLQQTYYFTILEDIGRSAEIELCSLSSADRASVCSACGNLDQNNWCGDDYRISVVDIQNASSDCQACEMLVNCLSKLESPPAEQKELWLSACEGSSLIVDHHGPGVTNRLEIFTEKGLQKPWPAVGYARPLQAATITDIAQLVSTWFRQCLSDHQTCGLSNHHLPTRVLHVGNESREPYLYETRNEERQYIALSHCWGGMQGSNLTTTRKSIENHKQGIPMAALSQTFLDAVLLSRELGIEYIWIDSLCIVQDDEEDWAREAAHMAEVYQHATLTISADGAANGSEGLFEKSTGRSVKQFEVQQTKKGKAYMRETTLEQYSDRVHVISGKSDQPLRTRAWALQEWLLSPRIVHFTKGEVLWECNTSQLCECQVTSQSSHMWDSTEEFPSTNMSKRNYHRDQDTDQVSLYWFLIVEEYSRRQLTRGSDKLPALSGLAAFAKPDARADYCAGLWKSEFPEALLWQAGSGVSKRPETYRAPSWSWASVDGPVRFNRSVFEYPDELHTKCQILEASTALATANPFGALANGFLKIKGVVATLPKRMRLNNNWAGKFTEGDRDYKEGSKYSDYQIVFGYDIDPLVSDPTTSEFYPHQPVVDIDEFCFLIVKRTTRRRDLLHSIALRPTKEHHSTYTRVGHLWMNYDGSNWESWITDTFSASERTITII